MRLILFVFLSVIICDLSAQIIVSGRILDKESFTPLEYVEIQVFDQTTLAETDLNGWFYFVIPEDEFRIDKFTVVLEGYSSKTIHVSGEEKERIIFLSMNKETDIQGSYRFKSKVLDEQTNTPLSYATIYDPVSSRYTTTDLNGDFELDVTIPQNSLPSVIVEYIGFQDQSFAINIDELGHNQKIYLKPEAELIDEITVVGSSFKDIIGVPVSLKTTSSALIQMNAGGGGDFTKLMQSLPGLTTINSFRNDLIVRGGSPTENTFFIDDIEIPYINHLSTQGSTGGTISMLNSQLIQEVDFIASGFPANRPDAMSGVFNIYLTDPYKEKEIVFGNDPTNLFINGMSSFKKTAFSFSLRKSYRELLLKQIGLAVLPSYSDFLLNMRHKLTDNSYLTFLLLGLKDDFRVNQDVNDSEVQQYLRDNLPTNQQSSITAGVAYKRIKDKSGFSLKLSYSRFDNAAQKNNLINNQNIKILDFDSNEAQITSQLELYQDLEKIKIKYGIGTKFNLTDYDVNNQYYNSSGLNLIDYNSNVNYNLSHLFLQTTYSIIPSKVQITLHQTFQLTNVRNQGLLSSLPYPRINGKISLLPTADFNFSFGQYSQLPENILLSYREESNYVNLDRTEFIKSIQVATGIELLKRNKKNQITIEGFYKNYYDYPFNTRENISLANFGADFGVIGNVPIDFTGKGRAYGIELFFRRTGSERFTGWFSYALSKSEFQDSSLDYIVSSWDARHIVNGVLSYRLNKKWSMSLNAKFQSALPYTPFDIESSSIVPVWDVNRIGIRDFNMLNERLGKSTTLIDLRFQRQWKWHNKEMSIYFDLENILANADSQQVLVFDRNESNMPVIQNPDSSLEQQIYKLREIKNAEGVFIPSFGFEFRL